MKRYFWPALHSLVLVVTLIMNYLSGTGYFNNKTVGSVSNQFDSLFQPAGYALSIWGFIYLGLIAFVVYQWVAWMKDLPGKLGVSGVGLIIANLSNAIWVYAWLNQMLALSVVLMLMLLISLIHYTVVNKLELNDDPLLIIFFIWWPVAFYLGWIVTASVANVSIYLLSIGWKGLGLGPVTWTLIMIAVATFIYLFLVFKRNMRESALVGIWALIALTVARWEGYSLIAYSSLTCAIILFVAAGFHGSRNKNTAPHLKMKRGEWK